VTVVGEVAKQGPIMISGATNVLQLIGLAGGLLEFADGKNILIIRTETNGQQQTFKFNYNDVKKGKNLRQNIQLRPGDTVVVP
jgi:polysaccharide export outer membrane protein